MAFLTLEERFWSKVKKTDGCWEWQGNRSPRGYGKFWNNGDMRAHRQAWIFTNGPIPEGHQICHKCDNPPCVRPDHLFSGTQLENEADKKQKGRQVKGEAMHTSKLTEDQVREILAITGQTQNEIAQTYGVSNKLIGYVQRRVIWRHVIR